MPQNVSSRLDEAEGGLREAGKKRFETIQAAAKKEKMKEWRKPVWTVEYY